MTSLLLTCEIGVAGWQKSLRELTAGAEKQKEVPGGLVIFLFFLFDKKLVFFSRPHGGRSRTKYTPKTGASKTCVSSGPQPEAIFEQPVIKFQLE